MKLWFLVPDMGDPIIRQVGDGIAISTQQYLPQTLIAELELISSFEDARLKSNVAKEDLVVLYCHARLGDPKHQHWDAAYRSAVFDLLQRQIKVGLMKSDCQSNDNTWQPVGCVFELRIRGQFFTLDLAQKIRMVLGFESFQPASEEEADELGIDLATL